MKRLFAVLVFGILCSCSSTYYATVPVERRNYIQIRNVEKPKADIYNAALEYFARAFVSANDVLQLKNPDTGKIVGKGITPISIMMMTWDIKFTFDFEARDGKYRVAFYDFMVPEKSCMCTFPKPIQSGNNT